MLKPKNNQKDRKISFYLEEENSVSLWNTPFKKIIIFTWSLFFILGLPFFTYQYIYKSNLAKKKINQGRALILKEDKINRELNNYALAENILEEVDKNLVPNFLEAFQIYGQAFLAKKEFFRSLEKLNKGFKIDPQSPKILASLGSLYLAAPGSFFEANKNNFSNLYPFLQGKDWVLSQKLDVALIFYQEALKFDKKNFLAMIGLGDVFFAQKDYQQAKKAYQKGIDLNPNQIEGYSSLLKFFLARNYFDQVFSLQTQLENKKKLKDLSASVLEKLLVFYFQKKNLIKEKESPFNLIIDQESFFRKIDSVLRALKVKEPLSPWLQLYYAFYNREKKNFVGLGKNLKFLFKEKLFFPVTLHLLGEYFYFSEDPVQSYKFLSQAVDFSKGAQPFFFEDNFWQIGETYFFLGNLFYYHFEKIKRESQNYIQIPYEKYQGKDKNYKIAKFFYLKALKEGFSEKELLYNLGRINYLEGKYKKALTFWLKLEKKVVTSPEIMLALGNTFYHLNKTEASRGEFLRIISFLDKDYLYPKENNFKNFEILSTAYNNLGVLCFLKDKKDEGVLNFWKAIDTAEKTKRINALAQLNLNRYLYNKKKKVKFSSKIPFKLNLEESYL